MMDFFSFEHSIDDPSHIHGKNGTQIPKIFSATPNSEYHFIIPASSAAIIVVIQRGLYYLQMYH
jgi:hypothetical protein